MVAHLLFEAVNAPREQSRPTCSRTSVQPAGPAPPSPLRRTWKTTGSFPCSLAADQW